MATAAPILALLAGLIAVLGVACAHFGVVAPFTGFKLFAGGALLGGLASVVVSLVGLMISRGGRDPAGRTQSLTGLALGLGLMIIVLAAARTAGDAPRINDISTDLDNPPAFASATIVKEYAGRNMNYPAEFVEVVRTSYPDLKPLRVALSPEEAFDRAIATAESLGWEIVARSDSQLIFDARAVSTLFRFVDDISVRILRDGPGARIDMRSKSRDGQSDLGANAARIRKFFDALK